MVRCTGSPHFQKRYLHPSRCAVIIIKRFGARGNMVGVAQLARAPGCGPGGPGFEPLYPPHSFDKGPVAQLVEQGTLNPKVQGSNPCRSTIEYRSQVYRLAFCFRSSMRSGRFEGCSFTWPTRLIAFLFAEQGRYPMVALRYYGGAAHGKMPCALQRPCSCIREMDYANNGQRVPHARGRSGGQPQ